MSNETRHRWIATVWAALAVALLFTGLILLQPDFDGAALPSMPPPKIAVWAPAAEGAPPAGEALQAVHSPALISLSAPLLLPGLPLTPSGTVGPSLEMPPIRLPDPPPMAAPLLAEPRMPPRRRALFAAPPVMEAARPQRIIPGYWACWTGQGRGVELDLTPLLALPEPDGEWCLEAVLQSDAQGRVVHVWILKCEPEPALRAAVLPCLYLCRVSNGVLPSETALSISGLGRAGRLAD